MEKSNYKKFFLMLTISFVIMYGVMFLNVVDSGHIYLSLTRFYMALLMVAPMAVLMLLLMKNMYQDKNKNILILLGSVLVFVLSLWSLRAQIFVNDKNYMQAMIPHHSSAILTSKKANIQDPEVKELSKQIIEAQVREIEQMKNILNRMK